MKKTINKRIFSIVLAMAMVISTFAAMPISVSAVETATDDTASTETTNTAATATVYTETDGTYTAIENHDEDNPIDVKSYAGKTLYVIASGETQALYFAYNGLFDWGTEFSIDDTENATLVSGQSGITGHHAATVILDADAPADTQIVLTANNGIVTKNLTIKVIKEIPESPDDSDSDGDDSATVVKSSGDVTASFTEDAFGKGVDVNMSVSKITLSDSEKTSITEVVKSLEQEIEVCEYHPVDITFTDNEGETVQPQEGKSVAVSMELPEAPEEANMIIVVHLDADGAEVVEQAYTSSETKTQSISFGAKSFSSYVAVYANGKYDATLLREALTNDSKYTIKELSVNLFNYDPITFNDNYTGDRFMFPYGSYFGDGTKTSGSSGINNATSVFAKQGILEASLNENGLPTMKYGKKDMAENLFSTTTTVQGKTVYANTPFEFVYDKTTQMYTYKSAANHAQYNSANQKVELYTDSLSVINNRVKNFTLDSYSAVSDANLEYGDQTLRGTVTNTDTTDGLDPRITYSGFTQNAENVSKIYIKMKVSHTENKDFQLFFKTEEDTKFKEPKSFKANYTGNSNQEWIEIVLDTSVNEQWTGTVTEIRVDPYNGGQSGSSFEIAEVSFIGNAKSGVNANTNGGFYPFSDIGKSYPGISNGFNRDSWGDLLIGKDLSAVGSRAIYNGTTAGTSAETSIGHLAFGLSTSLPFYLPADKKLATGNEIIYEFTGDDDLWVFVDGKLVLDIGGGHGAIHGSINFTTGEVKVDSAVTVTGYDSYDASNVSYKNNDPTNDPTGAGAKELNMYKNIDSALGNTGQHTMQIFYLERAASVSNCFMKFNLPIIPQGAVTVTKKVEAGEYSPDKDTEYNFAIEKIENGEAVSIGVQTYEKIDTKGIITSGTIGTDGKFTLKAGETISFPSIDENTVVKVTEDTPTSNEYFDYDKTDIEVSVNKAEATVTTVNKEDENAIISANEKVEKNGTVDFTFTNCYEDKIFDLTIIKTGANEAIDPDQSFVFNVKGVTDTATEDIDLDVVIVGNGSKTIKSIPAGDYTITEKNGWSWRYTLDSSDKVTTSGGAVKKNSSAEASVYSPEITLSGSNGSVKFDNSRTMPFWLDGNSWCQNEYGKSSIGIGNWRVSKNPVSAGN